MIREIVAVGIGGPGQYVEVLVSYVWLAEQSLLGFPAGTFTVNAAGSLLMGFCWRYWAQVLRRGF